jgi:signal peptidase I
MAPPEDGEDEDSSDGRRDEEELSRRDFALLLARDVAFAVLLVGLVIGALFAYARVWPPMVVVESGSMQHSGVRSHLGVIDTGDLVLLQSVSSGSDVVTYVDGRVSGYKTYSTYGDVIVFHPPGSPPGVTPIIHRAMLYVEFPSSTGGAGVDIPSLAAPFPADEWSGTDSAGDPTTSPYGLQRVILRVQSWHTGSETMVDLDFNFASTASRGFMTKGDHNMAPEGGPPVPVSAIIGKSRGELPWFGLIKLTVWPTGGCCPSGWGDPRAPRNSWDSLATSLVLLPVGIFLADYGFAFVEKTWKARKDRTAEPAPAETEEPPPAEDPASESDDDPR